MIDHFLPHLVHYSTLTAICRALDVNDDQAIPMPTAGSKLQLAATRKWNTLRASVANRKKLLEEYRRAAIPSLCGYQQVSPQHSFFSWLFAHVLQPWQCPKDKLVKFQECSGCEYEQYCSRSCQRADWKRHKAMCNSPAIAKYAFPASYIILSNLSCCHSTASVTVMSATLISWNSWPPMIYNVISLSIPGMKPRPLPRSLSVITAAVNIRHQCGLSTWKSLQAT